MRAISLLLLLTSNAAAQVVPYPYDQKPMLKLAALTWKYRADGINAHNRLPPSLAAKLDEIANGGNLEYLHDAKAALRAIAAWGAPVGQWFIDNHEKLRDRDALEAFLKDPEGIATGEVDFAEATRKAKERRGWKKLLEPVGLCLASLVLGLLIGYRIRPRVIRSGDAKLELHRP